jgi:hypothetical protein
MGDDRRRNGRRRRSIFAQEVYDMKLRPLIATMLILVLVTSGTAPLSAQASGEKVSGKKSSVQAAGGQDAPQAFGRSAKLSTDTLKKRAIWPWIVGGVLVAGGVLAYFLLRDGHDKKDTNGTPAGPITGSVQVNSTPQGARVYLDGADTGKVTNCLLSNLAPGSHAVKLTKEGYADAETKFEVAASRGIPTPGTRRSPFGGTPRRPRPRPRPEPPIRRG